MKRDFAKKFSYIGAGLGLALFALFGLLYGSFLGGLIGLSVVNDFSGPAAAGGIIARIAVAVGMVSGVLVACVIAVVSCTAAGWAVGYVIDSIIGAREKSRRRQAFNR
jgi:uncharacterized membrane protein